MKLVGMLIVSFVMIVLIVLAYFIPDYAIAQINQAGVFSEESINQAQDKVNLIRSIAILAIFIAWIAILFFWSKSDSYPSGYY